MTELSGIINQLMRDVGIILIVEDNKASGQILEQIILNRGHRSLGIMSSPEEALLLVKNSLPDLVFMDIDLSTHMDGIHTAELISGYFSVPVVFASIFANEEMMSKAQQYGIGYVVKPFTPEEIEDMIDLTIEKKFEFQPAAADRRPVLRVKDDNRLIFIDLHDVVYFEARQHTVLIYTVHRTFKLNTSLKEIKARDVNNCSVEPHRSFLVNRAFITELIHDQDHYSLKLRSLSELIPVGNDKVKRITTSV